MVMATQMAFCFVLLVAAGLLLRTLENYRATNLGMRTQGLLVFGITPQKTSTSTQNSSSTARCSIVLVACPGLNLRHLPRTVRDQVGVTTIPRPSME